MRLKCDGSDEANTDSQILSLLNDDSIIERTSNCERYFRGIENVADLFPEAPDEIFPLAFSHLVHKQIGILEMQFALQFRPENMHCVYIDLKAEPKVKEAVRALLNCYQQRYYSDNVEASRHLFIYDTPTPIIWGDVSILEADLACLREMVRKREQLPEAEKWQYFINVAGVELPLKPEREMKSILRSLNGKSITMGDPNPHEDRY